MHLSVIIPAYNEEKTLDKNIREFNAYLAKQKYDYEIILVNDGSKDNTETVARKIVTDIPDGWESLDIGPETRKNFKEVLSTAKTIVWNGPVGVFEVDEYAEGTKEIAEYIATLKDVTSIVGGGDSAAAVSKFNVEDAMTHISTGGGASLEFLEGKELPGIAALKDKQV
jgi:3-phosphoglycerate kinase